MLVSSHQVWEQINVKTNSLHAYIILHRVENIRLKERRENTFLHDMKSEDTHYLLNLRSNSVFLIDFIPWQGPVSTLFRIHLDNRFTQLYFVLMVALISKCCRPPTAGSRTGSHLKSTGSIQQRLRSFKHSSNHLSQHHCLVKDPTACWNVKLHLFIENK